MSEDHSGLDTTQMSFGDHLEELRFHVFRSVFYFVAAFAVALLFQETLFDVAAWPFERTMDAIVEERQTAAVEDVLSSDERDALNDIGRASQDLEKRVEAIKRNRVLMQRRAQKLGIDDLEALQKQQESLLERLNKLQERQKDYLDEESIDPQEAVAIDAAIDRALEALKILRKRSEQAEQMLDRRRINNMKTRLQQLAFQETFMAYLKACFIVALFVAAPLISMELWKFISKGLYDHEKRWVNIIAPLSFVTFILGCAFGYFILIPYGLRFLATYGNEELVEGSFAIGSYFSLFITLTLVVGMVFQLPLLMAFTTLIRITDHKTFSEKRRYFLFASVIVSAVLTPPDPVTQLLMAGPIVLLFEVGVIASRIIKTRQLAQDARDEALYNPPGPELGQDGDDLDDDPDEGPDDGPDEGPDDGPDKGPDNGPDDGPAEGSPALTADQSAEAPLSAPSPEPSIAPPSSEAPEAPTDPSPEAPEAAPGEDEARAAKAPEDVETEDKGPQDKETQDTDGRP